MTYIKMNFGPHDEQRSSSPEIWSDNRSGLGWEWLYKRDTALLAMGTWHI